MTKAYLILQNGTVFTGRRFGASRDTQGEAVFTTAMTGYLETLTDPSYQGQLVVQTFPLVGDYGVIPSDFESGKPFLGGYIVREVCDEPSNFRSEGKIEDFLINWDIPGICGIDTRALTRQIRTQGVMNAALVSALPADLPAFCQALAARKMEKPVPKVTGTRLSDDCPENPVVLWDMGFKEAMKRGLTSRGLPVKVMPADATAADILALNPRGLLISNGPGDPSENEGVIRELRTLMQTDLPMLGICLGYQLMALAAGATSVKMKFGHRGENQPVKDLTTGKLYITCQNHGYAIQADSLPQAAKPWFINANDGSLEGILYTDRPALSVQFHPEACGGPLDTSWIFDRFAALLAK